jgi:peptidyl-prolyl cis-trans isomerase D
MLQTMRKAARSWVAGILIGLLVISFAVWGINDVFRGRTQTAVAVVDGREIAPAEFQQAFRAAVRQASAQAQRDVTEAEAREAGLGAAVLERMVGEAALDALARRLGLIASDAVAAAEIQNIPAFKNPVTGAFDANTYRQILSENGFTVQGFEDNLRRELARRKLLLAAGTGVLAPPAFASLDLAFRTERRGVTVLPLDPGQVEQPGVPTDAQLKALYDSRREQLMMPERRTLTLALGAPQDFASAVQAPDEKVRELYEFRKGELGVAATRTFVQIVAPDEAKAREAARRLAAGEDAAAIARALGLQAPLSFNAVRADQVPDKAVAEAVFALEAAGATPAVKGALAWAAARVTALTNSETPSFAEAAPALRAEIAAEEAQGALLKATELFEDATADGATLEAAARQAGLRVLTLAPVDAEGRRADGQPESFLATAPDALNVAFDQAQSEIGEMVNLPGGGYTAVRVDAIQAAAPRPLAEVREPLAAQWRLEELERRLRARAEAIAAEARKTTLDAAARPTGRLPVRRPRPLLRGETDNLIGPELGQAIFTARKGDVVIGRASQPGVLVVARIDTIERDADNAVPARVEASRQANTQSLAQDLVLTLERTARNRFKAETFPARATAAIGGAPEGEDGAAPTAPTPGAPAR